MAFFQNNSYGQARLEDSNLASYGSEDHRKNRLAAAKKEKAWANAGEKSGLQIWRINKFRVENWPTAHYSEFYDSDAYIILNTKKDQDEKSDDKVSHNIHVWIGTECTQDKVCKYLQ